MKNIGISFFLLFVFFVVPQFTHAQCDVLLKPISGEYEGDCKKGKADGQGTAKGVDSYEGQFKKGLPEGQGIYIWENGDAFVGEFKKGKKQGQGKITYKTDAGDSVVVGYWADDQYIGKEKDPYKVFFKGPEILSARFSRREGNDEIIFVFEKGGRKEDPGSMQLINMEGSFGSIIELGLDKKVTAVRYPFRGKMTQGGKTLEFSIAQPGTWTITISYN